MAQFQRSSFIAMGGFLSLLALSASPILAAEKSPTFTAPRIAVSSPTCPPPANRDALWNLVGCCTQSPPRDSHCRVYNNQYNYIVAKDASAQKTEAYLIIPTIKMIGIESPLTLNSPTLDIWQDGWSESVKLKYDQSKLGLAINSAISRDQDQLHIHMSCVNANVLNSLDRLKEISSNPAKPTAITLTGKSHAYEAVLLKSLSGESSPFKVMRQLPHVSEHDVKDQSIAIVKGRGAQNDKYILLNTYASGSNPGEAEELLDQTCSQ